MEKENHIMQLNDDPFEAVKQKRKTIEMRLYDEKRQKIKVGDIIKFLRKTNHEDFVYAKVKNLYPFNSFAELYKEFDKGCLGYKENELALPEDMAQYYDDKDIKKYGVLAIEIEVK